MLNGCLWAVQLAGSPGGGGGVGGFVERGGALEGYSEPLSVYHEVLDVEQARLQQSLQAE